MEPHPSDAVHLKTDRFGGVLILADGESRSLVEVPLAPNPFVALSDIDPIHNYKKWISGETLPPDLYSRRIGLQGTQPSQIEIGPGGDLLFVRFLNSALISVVATDKLYEIAVLDYEIGAELEVLTYLPALLAKTDGFLYAIERSGTSLLLYDVGDKCGYSRACFNDQRPVNLNVDYSSERAMSKQQSILGTERPLPMIMLASDKVSGTILLGVPNQTRLHIYESLWVQPLRRALVGYVGRVKLPTRIAELHADHNGRCLAGLASTFNSILFLCPNNYATDRAAIPPL